MAEQKQVSFQDWYNSLRSQIILSYDNAKEVALKNYDQMASKLGEQLQIIETMKTVKENKEPEKTSE